MLLLFFDSKIMFPFHFIILFIIYDFVSDYNDRTVEHVIA